MSNSVAHIPRHCNELKEVNLSNKSLTKPLFWQLNRKWMTSFYNLRSRLTLPVPKTGMKWILPLKRLDGEFKKMLCLARGLERYNGLGELAKACEKPCLTWVSL